MRRILGIVIACCWLSTVAWVSGAAGRWIADVRIDGGRLWLNGIKHLPCP